jgi:ribonuclease E
MAEKLLVNVTHEETRVALVDGGVLSNLEIDTSKLVHTKGNVYKGVIHRVNQSLQAAFVDYGSEKQGFLPVSEIHHRYYPAAVRGKRVPIQEILREGQELMVQVVKDEIGNKGASLSSYVSLPGRYLVLMPDTGKTGISRRLDGDERQRLKKVIADLPVPDGFGVIIRTAGEERAEIDLAQDLEFLTRLWEHLEEGFKNAKGAGLIHRERSLALRFIRDYVTGGIDELLVDERDTFHEIQAFCHLLMPEMKDRVRFYNDTTPLFSRYQVEDQIDDVFARKIELPSGGSIVIDQTEALVAIDVNSGRVKTDDIEKTALKTNMEAATAVARQLKLRDLGGLIVVDFIDMRSKENTRDIEAAARGAFEADKAKVKFSRISEFGLMEISRQRLKSSIMKGSFNSCSNCGGTGRLRSVESSALYLLRRMKEAVLRGTNYMHVTAKMPVNVANYLLNRKRRELSELEVESRTTIDIKGVVDCPPTRAYVEILAASAQGRGARRLLLTFDLVRSDVERRELEHLEEIIVDAAHARNLDLTEDQYANLYRRIEEDMGKDAEQVAARYAIEKKGAVDDAVATERKRSRDEPKPAGGGITGWFTNLFSGTSEEVVETREKPARRSSSSSPSHKPGSGRRGADSSQDSSRRRRRRSGRSGEGSGQRDRSEGGSDDNAKRSDRSDRSARSDRSDRSARSDRSDRSGRSDRSDRSDRPDRSGRPERNDDARQQRADSRTGRPEAGEDGSPSSKRRRRRRGRGRGGAGSGEQTGDQSSSQREASASGDGSSSEAENSGRSRRRGADDSRPSASAPTERAVKTESTRSGSGEHRSGDTALGATPRASAPAERASSAAPARGADAPQPRAVDAPQPRAQATPASPSRAPASPSPRAPASSTPAKVRLPKAGGVVDLRASGLTLPTPSEASPRMASKPTED